MKYATEPDCPVPDRRVTGVTRMLSTLRLAASLMRVLLHIVVALAIVAVAFPFQSQASRERLIRWWSRRVLVICGMRVRVVGPSTDPERGGLVIDAAIRPGGIGAMLVMNHVSWIDIYVVHALRPARFVAKAEISRWPLIGFLTDRTGTIFIERGRRHAVRDANQRVAQLLRQGDLIGMFPEGTTSDGDRLLTFHANLIQPAIDARAPIVVAGLRYLDARGRPTTASSYVGDTNLFDSIVRIVRAAPLTAELHLIATIDGGSTTRHAAARTARGLIADALGFDDEADEALEDLSTVIVMSDDDSEAAFNRDAAPADRGPGTPFDPRDELL